MFIRMSKTERPYTLKKERPGYYDKEIKKIEEEIQASTDPDEKKEKQDLITELERVKKQTEAHVEKYGPARFFIKSASKEELAKLKSRVKANLGTTKDKDTVTSGMLSVSEYTAVQQVKLGFVRVENIIDMDSEEDPETHKKKAITISHKQVDDFIDNASMDVIYELAGEIGGNVSEEEEKNS